MAKFGEKSLAHLSTVEHDLRDVMMLTIKHIDFSVIQGYRGEEEQNRYYLRGLSRVRWPHGKHNAYPSRAVDLAPYPIDWSNDADAVRRFVLLAGFVLCTAAQVGVQLRWGGDWDGDLDLRDERGKLRDWGHFELKGSPL